MSELLQLHAHAIKLGLEGDVSVTSQLLSFCVVSDAGSLDYRKPNLIAGREISSLEDRRWKIVASLDDWRAENSPLEDGKIAAHHYAD
ncbi:hypothetical protein ACLOJK_040022 [Asimina triloba]